MSKAADKSKRANRETFPSYRVIRKQFCTVSGWIGRLKAIVKIVGREVVCSFWSRDGIFLRRGVTRAVLKTSGKMPEDREELTRAVGEGRRVLRHSTSRGVGIRSS